MSTVQFKPGLVIALLAAGVACLFAEPSPEAWSVPEHVDSLKNPLPANASDTVTKGRQLYQDRCGDCHGSKGRGDGSAAADLSRKPTDLTKPAAAQQTDGALYWKITEGRRPMPGFRDKLSEEQRWQLVAYLRTLARKDSKDSKPKDSKPSKSNP